MRIFVFIFICFLFITSCEKEKIETISPISPISYTVYNPTLELITGRKDTLYAPFKILLPIDTSSSIRFDVDNDGILDIEILAERWYEFFSNSSPTSNYHSKLSLLQIDPSIQFNNNNNIYPYTEMHGENISTHTMTNWNKYSFPIWMGWSFSGTKYIAIRKIVAGNYYYGWIKIQRLDHFNFKIFSAAMNPNPNSAIKTGQRAF